MPRSGQLPRPFAPHGREIAAIPPIARHLGRAEISSLAVKLRLKRFGRLNHPTYRVVVADARSPRDGRIIESIGYYLPKMPRAAEQMKLNTERVSYWLSVGAQPSETVRSLIRKSGVELPVKKKRVRGKSKAAPKAWTPPKKKNKRSAKKSAPAAGGQSEAAEK